MHRFALFAVALGLALCLAACGKKGPLDKPGQEKDDGEKTALVLSR